MTLLDIADFGDTRAKLSERALSNMARRARQKEEEIPVCGPFSIGPDGRKSLCRMCLLVNRFRPEESALPYASRSRSQIMLSLGLTDESGRWLRLQVLMTSSGKSEDPLSRNTLIYDRSFNYIC